MAFFFGGGVGVEGGATKGSRHNSYHVDSIVYLLNLKLWSILIEIVVCFYVYIGNNWYQYKEKSL